MMVDTRKIISITDANQNFSKVTKKAAISGEAIIFRRNKPAYILIDVKKMGPDFIRDYEDLMVKHLAKAAVNEYNEVLIKLAE